jgi:flagellar hook-length control protein FliK
MRLARATARSTVARSYAAAVGRGASEGVGATTTTGFPLHQVTSIVTTHTDASQALGTSAGSVSGSGLPAQIAAQVADTDAAQQVIRSMRLQWNGSVGEAQLRLQPEHLGQVLVSVRVDQGAVSATLQADSASAQQWIQTHQQELRQALQDQGLRVTEFNVTTNPDDRQRQNASQQQDQPRDRQQSNTRSRGDRQPSNGRTFEILV